MASRVLLLLAACLCCASLSHAALVPYTAVLLWAGINFKPTVKIPGNAVMRFPKTGNGCTPIPLKYQRNVRSAQLWWKRQAPGGKLLKTCQALTFYDLPDCQGFGLSFQLPPGPNPVNRIWRFTNVYGSVVTSVLCL